MVANLPTSKRSGGDEMVLRNCCHGRSKKSRTCPDFFAFRHCYYSCILNASLGEFGKLLTDQKEESDNRPGPDGKPRQGPLQSQMDYHNNWIGKEIAAGTDWWGEATSPYLPREANTTFAIVSRIALNARGKCATGCEKAGCDGTLKTISPPPPGSGGIQ